ncbi:hypothetical protein MTF65_01840 [Streptomyces sp. APSN-46.1]|uniref:hypothetical protein n=1 Tax=Streptomyces sp. APSN-46.1 TaxID=2929049 RepID=UPI001FB3D382|nr:hypothetical protein [Streptomyces sp. APSN-46.1]MCJ1676124.1 hypothetical protein [Streptomyces sp. APSN-46.1]
MGILDGAAKTAGQVRDAGHAALGGKNASGLKHQVVTVKGRPAGDQYGDLTNTSAPLTLEAKAPAGYIVTGGGFELPEYNRADATAPGPADRVNSSRPSDSGTAWTVSFNVDFRGPNVENYPEFTVYAVCVAADH